MLRVGNITMQGARALYTVTLEGLKLEAEYGKINDLTDIDIIQTISMAINILSIIALICCVKYDKWIKRMQAL